MWHVDTGDVIKITCTVFKDRHSCHEQLSCLLLVVVLSCVMSPVTSRDLYDARELGHNVSEVHVMGTNLGDFKLGHDVDVIVTKFDDKATRRCTLSYVDIELN